MNSMIIIAGEKLKKGTQKSITLKISEFYTGNPAYIPVVVTNGKKEGPTIFITACLHGDEVNGTEIIRQLNEKIDPNKLSGTVITVPVVNLFGFYTMSRGFPDGRDLNKYFPGNSKGSPASRVAKILHDEIIVKCDYGVDIHTSRAKRYELSHAEADLSNKNCKMLAEFLGQNIIVNSSGNEGSLQKTASDEGIPTVVFSGGEVLRFNRKVISTGYLGLMSLLANLNMLPLESAISGKPLTVSRTKSILTKTGGMLHLFVSPGDTVTRSNKIASVMNPFGEEIESIYADETGLIMSVTTNPLVNPGKEVCAYVLIENSEEV